MMATAKVSKDDRHYVCVDGEEIVLSWGQYVILANVVRKMFGVELKHVLHHHNDTFYYYRVFYVGKKQSKKVTTEIEIAARVAKEITY
jgi:hypothetical protein